MDQQRSPYICSHGRVDGRETRGRTRNGWSGTVNKSCNARNLSPVDVLRAAEDRRRGDLYWGCQEQQRNDIDDDDDDDDNDDDEYIW